MSVFIHPLRELYFLIGAPCCMITVSVVGQGSVSVLVTSMPHKANAARRHHIPQPKQKVTNWAEYDAALRQRGSLTVWVSEEAIVGGKATPHTTPGGQSNYSDLAITAALILRAAFRLALRQTEGLIGSVIHLLGLIYQYRTTSP